MNMNLYTQTFVLFDSVKTPFSGTADSKSIYNNCCQNMNIEVKGMTSGTLLVQGCMCRYGSDGNALTDEQKHGLQLVL